MTTQKKYYITGVDKEAEKKYKEFELYVRTLDSKICNAPIFPEYYRDKIRKNIDVFNYYDKTVIILKIEAQNNPIKFGGKYYQRCGSNTEIVKDGHEMELFRAFIL